MSLCPACSRISVPNLARELDDPPIWMRGVERETKRPRGMVLHGDARNLMASASAGCPFCNLVVEAVLHYNTDVYTADSPVGKSKEEPHKLDLTSILAPGPIYLHTNCNPIKDSFPEDGVTGSWHIRGVKLYLPCTTNTNLTGRIKLYAEIDSPVGASCDIIGRPPLPASDSPEAFALIERWMSACLFKHQSCRESLAGAAIDESTPPVLPTRVIHVGQLNGAPSPRLLEPHGRRGHYVALSHCWGPVAHRPLMTVKANLAEHSAGIPWEKLPRLYQDAITVTHRLGFEYLWIDSLAIIQDSQSDWLSESQRMGDIYQQARLTIAASHAPDSSHSLFAPRNTPGHVVELPHLNSTIYATVLSKDYESISPESGILATRAWTTQEWLLSRRMLFYTSRSLIFSCKTLSQRETGASFHSTARNTRWKTLVEKYSARQLTQPTDRLIALEGIRAEMAKKRVNDVYAFGIWRNSLPDQLLWACGARARRDERGIKAPSWSWASVRCGVRNLGQYAGEGGKCAARNICEGIRFDEGRAWLSIKAQMRAVKGLVSRAHADFALSGSNPKAPLVTPPDMVFYLADDDVVRGAGSFVLDEGKVPECEVYCLRLMTATVKNPSQGVKKLVREWVLMLRKVDGEDVFERIGVGSIEKQERSWFEGVEVREVWIR